MYSYGMFLALVYVEGVCSPYFCMFRMCLQPLLLYVQEVFAAFTFRTALHPLLLYVQGLFLALTFMFGRICSPFFYIQGAFAALTS